ncbi:MAG: hypothetical protein B1H13_04335 [Desulfobacteraceae bacterium 4484_190.3]|nr:MAG: hypothetical protein B1H13_04335 [Desulfobacteraceae bacterium 4484_190.3]
MKEYLKSAYLMTIIGLTILTGFSVAARAEQMATSPSPAENLIFILDASGSMWGQVEGKAKIAIAKEVLTDLIRPKGKTPISRSVRLTADRIKGQENQTTIILVSDGKETCDPDPCRLVKKLKATGIKFVMHVIGFDVTQEERVQLECMANAGGGQYFTAGNAGEFLNAAREVVKKSTLPFGILKVRVKKNGKPFHTFVIVTNRESGKRWSPGSSSGKTGIALIRLSPGRYDVELKDTGVSGGKAPVVHLKDIVIVAGETVERSADFSGGRLVITTLLNGKPFPTTIFYYRQGEKKPFHNVQTHPRTGKTSRKLLLGTYRIEVPCSSIVGRPTVVFEKLEITPGGTTDRTANFSAGEVTVAATLDGKPFNTPFEVYDKTGKKIYGQWTLGRVQDVRESHRYCGRRKDHNGGLLIWKTGVQTNICNSHEGEDKSSCIREICEKPMPHFSIYSFWL